MSDILPIDREELVDEPEESVDSKVAEAESEGVTMEIEDDDNDKKTEAECFEKPNYNEKALTAKGKPRKRKMTEKQLENLRKAQAKSVARRKEMKEAKDLAKAEKMAEKEIEMEKKLAKKMEGEVRLKMAARMKAEATESARKTETWDEERLTALMERTLDNYVAKKRAMKPKPRETIPAPQPQQQYQYQPPQRQPPQHFRAGSERHYNHVTHSLDDPYSKLFGNYQ